VEAAGGVGERDGEARRPVDRAARLLTSGLLYSPAMVFASSARKVLRLAGVEVVARRPRNFPRLRRPLLIEEERITLALDVGANCGQWARELRDGGYRGRLVSFEPGREAFAELDRAAAGDPLWECHRLAIGSADGEAVLHVSANSVSSSLLTLSTRQLDVAPSSAVVTTETVELRRLDSVAGLAAADDRILLKADVEGGELDVLVGASGLLDRTRLLELELSALPLREGQPLLGEDVHWCESASFVLTGIEVSFRDRRTGDLLSANGFFRRV
jgi:FkbM family methyltransferase